MNSPELVSGAAVREVPSSTSQESAAWKAVTKAATSPGPPGRSTLACTALSNSSTCAHTLTHTHTCLRAMEQRPTGAWQTQKSVFMGCGKQQTDKHGRCHLSQVRLSNFRGRLGGSTPGHTVTTPAAEPWASREPRFSFVKIRARGKPESGIFTRDLTTAE